LAIESIV